MKKVVILITLINLMTMTTLAETIESDQYAIWGISDDAVTIPTGSVIQEAKLTVSGVTLAGNQIYVHLLDNPSEGFVIGNTESEEADVFAGYGVLLNGAMEGDNLVFQFNQTNDPDSTIWNLYARPFNLTLANGSVVHYTSSVLELMNYIGNGHGFGFGLCASGDEALTFEQATLQLKVASYSQPYSEQTITLNLFDGMNRQIVSGYVRTAGGQGIEGADVDLDNGADSTTTDPNGYFSTDTRYGWTGTITVSHSSYLFVPSVLSYSNTDVINHTIVEFTALNINDTTQVVAVSGYIKTTENAAVSDAMVSGDNDIGSVMTDNSGYYCLLVYSGWKGSINVSKPGYTFLSDRKDYSSAVKSNVIDQNYTAQEVCTISGYILSQEGLGVSGVTVSGGDSGVATTDSNGYYCLSVGKGWTGTVKPQKAGWTLLPAERVYAEAVENDISDQNYSSTVQTFTISGYVKTKKKLGISGVTVSGSDCIASVETDGSGYYCLTVNYGWQGTVTVSNGIDTFVPSQIYYGTPAMSNKVNQNYLATPVRTISGYIRTDEGAGVSGLKLKAKGIKGNVVTNGDGFYSMTAAYGWSGSITLSQKGYSFTPGGRSYGSLTTNMSDENYSVSIQQFTISGTVQNAYKAGIAGATVTASGIGSVQTDGSGYYSFTVNYGWSGTVSVSSQDYAFKKGVKKFSAMKASKGGQNFVANK